MQPRRTVILASLMLLLLACIMFELMQVGQRLSIDVAYGKGEKPELLFLVGSLAIAALTVAVITIAQLRNRDGYPLIALLVGTLLSLGFGYGSTAVRLSLFSSKYAMIVTTDCSYPQASAFRGAQGVIVNWNGIISFHPTDTVISMIKR